MADALSHIIYTSAATPAFDRSQIPGILQVSRRNNASRSITGMLLFIDNSFFQVLEGDEMVLNALFEIIRADPRHDRVTKIIQEPIARRAFDAWTMGFSEMNPADFENVEGLNDFFHGGRTLAAMEVGRAKKLAEAFRQGRWRAKLK